MMECYLFAGSSIQFVFRYRVSFAEIFNEKLQHYDLHMGPEEAFCFVKITMETSILITCL